MVLSTEEIKKEQEEENTTSVIGRPPKPDLQITQNNDGCLNRNDEHLDVETTSEKTYDSNVEMEKPLDRLIYGENTDSKQNCNSQMSKSLPSNSPQNSENEPDKRDREKESQQRDECSESRKLTNFSIDQILRDDFGPKRSRGYYDNDHVRQFPLLSAGAVLSSSSLSSSSSFYSPLCCPTASRLLSSSGFSAFSSVSKSNFVSKHPTSRVSVEKYYNSPALTPPPSSPESSTSSLSPSSTSRYHASKSSPKKEASSASYVSVTSSTTSSEVKGLGEASQSDSSKQLRWPAWVYCTRYSDRPSSGPRYRKPRQSKSTDKRPRTAFSTTQLQRLRSEFHDCPYLSESRRISLARELGLSESQVKIWFQNKRAKLKKGCGVRNPLAQLLMEEGLYNHSTIIVREDNDDNTKNKSNNNNNNNINNNNHKSDSINGGGAGSSKSVMVNN